MNAQSTIVRTLDYADQLRMVADVRRICVESPLVRPSTPNGKPMRVRVTAAGELGWTGGPSGYRYSPRDRNGNPWPPMPHNWLALADEIAGRHAWDSAIVNWYDPDAALGWHRDLAEHDQTLPIVTISLGDAASWAIRADEHSAISRCRLESGDVTLLAGPTRNHLHTIERVIPCPMMNPLSKPGRLSITIRVAGAPRPAVFVNPGPHGQISEDDRGEVRRFADVLGASIPPSKPRTH
jgi:alkylated DNA repair protein (DNA oxidative demethylase)